jgi:hypothetical protein
VAGALAVLVLTPVAGAQRAAGTKEPAVPFSVGETLTYDVSWSSFLVAGAATVRVVEKKPSFNSTAYYIVVEGKPVPLVAKLYNLYYKMDTPRQRHPPVAARIATARRSGAAQA